MEQGDNKMLPVESARYNTLIFKLNPFSNNLIRFYSPRVILERNWPNVDKLFVQAGERFVPNTTISMYFESRLRKTKCYHRMC